MLLALNFASCFEELILAGTLVLACLLTAYEIWVMSKSIALESTSLEENGSKGKTEAKAVCPWA